MAISGVLIAFSATATSAAESRETELWSLKPVQAQAPPVVHRKDWPRNSVDAFILARLEQNELVPSPEADRATLIRRLSFDLLGLPPTPEEIAAFESDRSAGAYEALVERLLASPHYGERWARHWLDVVRYTESQGFEYDRLRDNAWHYRDYVIDSFNEDKPYDQFVREQIAGDVLEPVTRDGIAATSLLVCGPWDEAGSNQANVTQRTITREEELEDLISAVSQTFLGMTVNCARCHAHKFDPIPQEDYYRIKSVFEGIRHGERTLASPAEIQEHERRKAVLQDRIAVLEREIGGIEASGADLLRERSQLPGVESLPALMRWTFPGRIESTVPGVLKGSARIQGNRLQLAGDGAFFVSEPIGKAVTEKTIEAWILLSDLDQGGGGVISIETDEGRVFDALVYAEVEKRRWMAGSEFYRRTKQVEAPAESAAPGVPIHLAIVYRADNSIALFRDGEPYGKPYVSPEAIRTFEAGKSRVLLGLRHTGASRGFFKGEILEAALHDRALNADEIAGAWRNSSWRISREELIAVFSPEQRASHAARVAQLEAARKELAQFDRLPVSYAGQRKQPVPTRLLKRGDVNSPDKEVTPGGLSAIASPAAEFGLGADAPEAERRVRFARWITDHRHPLTARVMANRLWHFHFGQGLVATPNDLGGSGALPSHPELLDWLADQFVKGGWRVKELHRLMVHSATYRQASRWNASAAAKDAENRWLWRFTPRRIEAEAVRDAMLAASGQMNWAGGGPSFRPFEIVKFNSSTYIPFDKADPEFNRRTVYRMNVNSGKEPLLDAFDCPDPSVKTPRRNVTITPLQALSLMNNPFVLRQSEALAVRVMGENRGDETKAILAAYRRTVGRAPDEAELLRAIETVRERGMKHLCWALFNSTEFLYVR